MRMYYFAKKLDGEILVLTEAEALIHFKDNNISRRMRLDFLGSSDGKHYKEQMKKVGQMHKDAQDLPISKRIKTKWSELTQQEQDDWTVQGGTQATWKGVLTAPHQEALDKIKAFAQKALDEEMEIAIKNGVTPPRKDLDYIVVKDGEVLSGEERNNILKGM